MKKIRGRLIKTREIGLIREKHQKRFLRKIIKLLILFLKELISS